MNIALEQNNLMILGVGDILRIESWSICSLQMKWENLVLNSGGYCQHPADHGKTYLYESSLASSAVYAPMLSMS